jgi:hypothetical protein
VDFLVEPQNQGQWVFWFGPKNDSFGLKIWVLKSPRWFLRLGLKTKPASVCWLLHKINGSRSARDTHQDLAVCFAWMQVGLGFSSLKDRRRRPEGGVNGSQ